MALKYIVKLLNCTLGPPSPGVGGGGVGLSGRFLEYPAGRSMSSDWFVNRFYFGSL